MDGVVLGAQKNEVRLTMTKTVDRMKGGWIRWGQDNLNVTKQEWSKLGQPRQHGIGMGELRGEVSIALQKRILTQVPP